MPEPTILDTILAHKREEVARRQVLLPLSEIKARAAAQPPPRDFAGVLQAAGPVALIAEVKKSSPSAGRIRADFDPVEIARIYEQSGASCLSVLTEEKFFEGQDRDLQDVRAAVTLPILRKDFLVDKWQVFESRALGADAVLLIAAALTGAQIRDWQAQAWELGMTVLVEVHTEAEMETALAAGATLVGINSRDLSTFVTDLGTVERLAKCVPSGTLLVAESGLKTPADVRRVAEAGAGAILVGETFMRAADIGAAVQTLLSRPEAP